MKALLLTTLLLTGLFSPQGFAALSDQDLAKISSSKQLLPNAGFEGSKSGWESTGSSVFTIDSNTPIFGSKSALWDPSTTGEFLRMNELVTPELGMKGATCALEARYIWDAGVSGQIEMQVRDNLDAVIASLPLSPTSSNTPAPAQLLFNCPDPGLNQMKVVFASTADAAQIKIDDLFLGTGKNTIFGIPSKQAVVNVTGSGSFTGGTLQIERVGNIVTVSIASTLTFSSTAIATSAVGLLPLWARPSGTVTTIVRSASASVKDLVFYADGGMAISIRDWAGASLVATSLDFGTISYTAPGNISPSDAITLETSGFVVEGTLTTATLDPLLPTVDQFSYQPIVDSTITLNQTIGPAGAAQVACNGIASTGTTCSGASEQIGVTINFPYTGKYMACLDWTHQSRTLAAAAYIDQVFKIAMTADGSNTIEQNGTVNHRHFNEGEAAGSQVSAVPFNSCSIFEVNTLRKSFKLFGYTDVGGSVDNNYIVMRGNAGEQRSVSFKIFPINQGFPTPVFTDLQNSLNAKTESAGAQANVVSVDISTLGAPNNEVGDWILSTSRSSAGVYVINIEPGVFSTTFPNCVLTPLSNSASFTQVGTIAANSFTIRTFNQAGTATDVRFSMLCHGVR